MNNCCAQFERLNNPALITRDTGACLLFGRESPLLMLDVDLTQYLFALGAELFALGAERLRRRLRLARRSRLVKGNEGEA